MRKASRQRESAKDTDTDRDRRAVRLGCSAFSFRSLVYCHFYCQRMHVKNCPKKPQSEQRKLKGRRSRKRRRRGGKWAQMPNYFACAVPICLRAPRGMLLLRSHPVFIIAGRALINHATSHSAAAREGRVWNLARNTDNGRGHCPHMLVVGRGRRRIRKVSKKKKKKDARKLHSAFKAAQIVED